MNKSYTQKPSNTPTPSILPGLNGLDKPVHYLVYRPKHWDTSPYFPPGFYPKDNIVALFFYREKNWRKAWGELLAEGESVREGVTTIREMLNLPGGAFQERGHKEMP